MRFFWRGLLLWLSVSIAWGEAGAGADSPPSLPQTPGYPLVGEFAYADDVEARAVWRSRDETAPVSVVQAGPRRALRLPCNLAGATMDRASWDWSVKLDLARVRGVQFRFFCRNPDPVAHFSVYFRSGEGWYGATFAPEALDEWNAVRIEKLATWIEDAPAGWADIDTVRISAWRSEEKDTECYIADFGLLAGDTAITILRNERAFLKGHPEARSVSAFAQTIAAFLGQLGLPYSVLGDLDLTAAQLEPTTSLILPYCPDLDDAAVAILSDFLGRAGKLVSFYRLPSELFPVVGFEKGNHVKQEYQGHFASIRPAGGGLTGLPPVVQQTSWNIGEVRPVEGRSRVAACWYNDAGGSTGYAAILVSDNCAHLTHVLRTDDPSNKRLLLLAMLGHFMPECWQTAARASLDQAGAVGPYRNLAEARAAIGRAAKGQSQAALAELGAAEALRVKATKLIESGNYPEAIATAGQARDQVLLAYCSVQRPRPGEFRAFWCHSAFGVDGMTWDEAVKNLAHNGFTAILPNMLWAGTAYYQSEVLPVASELEEKGDQIAQCLAACKKYGVQCHVWKVNWNMGASATTAFIETMKRAGRTQVLFDGAHEDRWLCPSHPANQRLEIDAMVEVATKYDVAGVHFDYIRYPSRDGCFCEGCRRRFEQIIGAEATNWPGGVRNDPRLEQRWLDFRRDQITKVVAAVSEAVRKVKPDIEISAAVFKNWPLDRDTVGQDWKTWCDKGYLDFVCPMDYTPSNAQFESLVRRQLAWAGDVPCYPGIGLSTWPDPNDVAKLIEQITIARRLGARGFTIFNYSVHAAGDMVPLCGKGITRK